MNEVVRRESAVADYLNQSVIRPFIERMTGIAMIAFKVVRNKELLSTASRKRISEAVFRRIPI